MPNNSHNNSHNNSLSPRGRTGQRRYGGRFFEEFLPELQGRQGIEMFKQMSENDSVIGAILFAVEMLVRQVKFDTEPASDSPRDIEAADFLKSCISDMNVSWQDTLSEMLSFLTYGFSYHEIVYKRRMGAGHGAQSSRYSDGLIGWRDFAIRAQDSLVRWEYGEGDELRGMVQAAPPDYEERFIPIDKALHLRTKSRKASPEGVSILRSCYRDYYFKKNLQETEGIGAERGAVGLPVLTPPEGVNIWDDDPDSRALLSQAEQLVRNVRRDNVDGVVLPYGWKLELMGGGARQPDLGAIIERYDRRIAMSVLADFIMLGSNSAGSYALSSDKTELFSLALGTYLDIICDALNSQAIPRLFDMNRSAFSDLTELPKLVHGDIEKPDLDKLGSFIERMTGAGLLRPDLRTEKYVRRLAELPEIDLKAHARREVNEDVRDSGHER